MKELASESANGTYQNEVDRDAIQLEFDQLNDELDQIADTDFNGTVMLNGGQMADGTKAANGKFDYANSTRSAQQVGTAGGYVNGIATDAYNNTKGDETVTFTATKNDDGTVTWAANETALDTISNNTSKTGGFTYAGAVISVDTTKIVTGDTIVVNFSKAQDAVGQTSDTVGYNTDTGTMVTDGTFTGPTLTVTATDAKVTSDRIADAVNYLNGLSIETTVTSAAKIGTTTVNGTDFTNGGTMYTYKDGSKITLGADDGVITYEDASGAKTALGTITKATLTSATAADTTAGTVTTSVLTTTASYTPATSTGVTLVEPESKVSQSNSNDAATAPLTYTSNLVLQTGARTKDSVDFTFSYSTDGMGDLKANMNISSRADGLNTSNLSLATQEDANYAIDQIDNAINKVSMVRATFGATQNRLEYKVENLTTTSTNLTEAESNIRDVDMASEMMNYTKYNILQQAAQSMLAQANQQPQSILQLLG
jgi:flagellin